MVLEKRELFREKNLERLNVPEQEMRYLQIVASPRWMFVLAVLLLLIGCVAWWGIGMDLNLKLAIWEG